MCTRCTHCTQRCIRTVHWDIAIDAEYNRISSIVENSIDEENNVDGGFSNLETHTKTVITLLGLQCILSGQWTWYRHKSSIEHTINPLNISHFIQDSGGWNSLQGRRRIFLNWPYLSRLFNFQILVDTDWFLFGRILTVEETQFTAQ